MRVAAIDIGSYTLQMSVATVGDEGSIMLLGDFSQDTRLIHGLSTERMLAPESMEACLDKLALLQKILKGLGVTRARAVGTAALRLAQNAEVFLDRARRILGEPVEILPEGEESAYVYLASHDVRPVPEGGLRVVVDVGGGSTELAVGDESRLLEVFAIPHGAARVSQRFLEGKAPRSEEVVALCEFLDQGLELDPIREFIAGRPIVVMGCGSSANGAAALEAGGGEIAQNPKVHGFDVSLEAMVGWLEALAQLDPGTEADLIGERGAELTGGIAIWVFLLEKLGAAGMVASDYGLRHGLIREMLGMERTFR